MTCGRTNHTMFASAPEEECDHDWQVSMDYEGDPGVINGTNTFYTKVCSICGEQLPATEADLRDAQLAAQELELQDYLRDVE